MFHSLTSHLPVLILERMVEPSEQAPGSLCSHFRGLVSAAKAHSDPGSPSPAMDTVSVAPGSTPLPLKTQCSFCLLEPVTSLGPERSSCSLFRMLSIAELSYKGCFVALQRDLETASPPPPHLLVPSP